MNAHVDHALRTRMRRAHEELGLVLSSQLEQSVEGRDLVASGRAGCPAHDERVTDVVHRGGRGRDARSEVPDRGRLAVGFATDHMGSEAVEGHPPR